MQNHRLTAVLCRWICTYEDLLVMQVCSDPPPRQCSIAQGKMHSPLLSAALQYRLSAGLCPCKYTYKDLLFIQACSDPPTRRCSTVLGKMYSPSAQCCSANLAHNRQCVSANTPMKICSSHMCVVTHHLCTAVVLQAKCIPHCSVLLCKSVHQPTSALQH